MTSPAYAVERAEWHRILHMKPDPSRAWWLHLSDPTRAAVLSAAGFSTDFFVRDWDALPEQVQAGMSKVRERREAAFHRLNREFSQRPGFPLSLVG